MFLLALQRGCGLSECSFFTVAILDRPPNSHLVLLTAVLKQHCMSVPPLLDSSIMCKLPRGTALAWDTVDVDWVHLDSMLSSRVSRKESVEKSLSESSLIFLAVGHLIWVPHCDHILAITHLCFLSC